MSIEVNSVDVLGQATCDAGVAFTPRTYTSADTTVDTARVVAFIDASGGSVTLTLGAGASDGQWLQLICVDATNAVTVNFDTGSGVYGVDGAGNRLTALSFQRTGQSGQLFWNSAASRWYMSFGGYNGTLG